MRSLTRRSTIRFTFIADDNGANLPDDSDISAEIAYRYTPGDSLVGAGGMVEILSVMPLYPELEAAARRKLSDLLMAILENESLPYGREAREKCADDVFSAERV